MTMRRDYRLGIFFTLINTLAAGVVGLIDKIGSSKTVSPFVFSTQSVFFAFVFTTLFTLFFFRGLFLKKIKEAAVSSWRQVFAIGIFSSGLFTLFRFLGLRQATGTFASLSQVVTTSLTAIFAYIFLKERLSKKFWLLFLVIIASMYFVSIGKFELASMKNGDLFILGGTIFLAIGNIFSKVTLKKVSPIILSFGRLLFGFMFLFLMEIIFLGVSADFYHPTIFSVLSGFLLSIMIMAFNFAIQKIGVVFVTSLLMTYPAITMVLESSILHKSFTLVQVLGAFIIVICGVLIVRVNSPKKALN